VSVLYFQSHFMYSVVDSVQVNGTAKSALVLTSPHLMSALTFLIVKGAMRTISQNQDINHTLK